jgi:hypothetical protein
MSDLKSDQANPGARLLHDVTNAPPTSARLEPDNGTESYKQRSEKEMQNPITKRDASAAQDPNSRRAVNGYMPVSC